MQSEKYIIYGSEYSPFSVKVRSYFRYKGIPHEWRPRTQENYKDFQAHAKLPLIPLVICPDGTVLQDSTPIIEKMEAIFPEASVNPENKTLSFLSAMLEEYGDEWVNKPMFHYRWWRDVDQIVVAEGVTNSSMPNGSEEERQIFAAQFRERMVPRLSFVGSSEQNKPLIEQSLTDILMLLERHLQDRDFLFGGKPVLADFGLFCQLYGCTQQPTSAKMIADHPNVTKWIDEMIDPEATGELEPWENLAESLMPFIMSQVAELYLPWATENAKALKAEESTFTVTLKNIEFSQDTIKYAARSLQVLKNRFAALTNREGLEDILISTGCLTLLVNESW